MLNNLLNVISEALIFDVFIILAAVIAGAVIVYLAWEGIASAIKKGKKAESQNLTFEDNNKNASAGGLLQYSLDKETEHQNEQESTQTQDENLNLVDVDEKKAEEEKQAADAETSDEEKRTAARRAALEARRQELIRRMQEQINEENSDSEQEEKEEESETVEETSDGSEEMTAQGEQVPETSIAEIEEMTDEQKVEEVPEEPAMATISDEEKEKLEEERKALNAEKERYQTMLQELETAKQELLKQKESEKAEFEKEEAEKAELEANQNRSQSALSLDELKARLAETIEKQKITEKEFKQCKKDYIPLRKVWDAHEKDEKKLRRKEALVAKQKVLLYGVNNYADIDQEKAQKLAEDLDLLDGLKLSVQHCEEVMKDNAERYPLLEKMYNVLKTRNDELKADIETYTAEIERLENQSNSEE